MRHGTATRHEGFGSLFLLALAVHYLGLAFEETRAAEERQSALQVHARDAELRALRAQLDPHFLYNCLNSIAALTSADAASRAASTTPPGTVTQSDGSSLTVIVVKSRKLEPAAHVTLSTIGGNTPIAGGRSARSASAPSTATEATSTRRPAASSACWR
jgi:hypothetical protein